MICDMCGENYWMKELETIISFDNLELFVCNEEPCNSITTMGYLGVMSGIIREYMDFEKAVIDNLQFQKDKVKDKLKKYLKEGFEHYEKTKT